MEREHDDGWQQEKVADPVTVSEFARIEVANRDLHPGSVHGSLRKGLDTEPPLTFRSAIRNRFRTGVEVFGYLNPSRGSVAGNSLFGRSQTTL
jgi:hypothetical protein